MLQPDDLFTARSKCCRRGLKCVRIENFDDIRFDLAADLFCLVWQTNRKIAVVTERYLNIHTMVSGQIPIGNALYDLLPGKCPSAIRTAVTGSLTLQKNGIKLAGKGGLQNGFPMLLFTLDLPQVGVLIRLQRLQKGPGLFGFSKKIIRVLKIQKVERTFGYTPKRKLGRKSIKLFALQVEKALNTH